MFKKLNKSGIVETIIAGGVAFSMVIAAVILTPQHRIRRAIEAQCGVESFRDAPEDCATYVAGLPKNEIMAIIKDD